MTDWDSSGIEQAIAAHVERQLAAARAGVGDAMEYVLGESSRIVPLEEGPLQDSGRTAVKASDGAIVGAVGYGSGPAADYAIPQHERTDYHHDDGRQAKFLEVPLVAAGVDGTLLRIVARRL